MPYHLTAGVAANVPDELGRGVHRPFISGFTCTSLFPKVVQWSVEVLGAWCLVLRFVSTCDAQVPFAPRGPGARANVCDSGASTPAHLNLQDTWRAWARREIVLRLRRKRRAATAGALGGHGSEGRQQQRVDMGLEAVCLFLLPVCYCCYDTYVIGPQPRGRP